MQDYNKGGDNEDGNFFSKFRTTLTQTFDNVKTKLKEVDWKENYEKLKETSNKAYKVVKKAGKYVITQSKPIVENLTEKTKNLYNEIVKPEPTFDLKIEDSDDFKKSEINRNFESYINEPFCNNEAAKDLSEYRRPKM